jgi:hypothetical protein
MTEKTIWLSRHFNRVSGYKLNQEVLNMYTRFAMLYKEVFDKNGEVKLCGRSMCQEIILLANQIETGIEHGNPYTGMMDIEAIQSLYQKLTRKAV